MERIPKAQAAAHAVIGTISAIHRQTRQLVGPGKTREQVSDFQKRKIPSHINNLGSFFGGERVFIVDVSSHFPTLPAVLFFNDLA
ncbi:MAG: hypothetical protein AB1412_10875 [Pseudomonadota bacterium]